MELKEIQDLIKFVAKSGVSEVELESKGFKIVIKTGGGQENVRHEQTYIAAPMPMMAPPVQMPAAVATPAPVAETPKSAAAATPAAPAAIDTSNLITIKSPMIGTFYRSAGPDKPAFVNIGDEVKGGKVLCIIEAMKLFNEIESEHAGTIVKVLVDDGSPVEYDQPLFLIQP
ncbi:MAG TPA: acetyl-CoA carboxylase biotin carboxyl carrier protein [Bacteroidia bacterium]|nr:acetyl-CoA carboxylase biotin carboxyl carrier protein [Bacteroidia bacterium]